MRSGSEWDVLCSWAEETAGLTLAEHQVSRLRAYVDLLRIWNRRIALVSRADSDRLVNRHIADSLFAAAHCTDGEAVVDLGSGAGLPGLPIAILRPASRVCLVESTAKKVSFLVEAVRVTGSSNVTVCHARMESAANDDQHRGRYAVAISRALANSDQHLAAARALLAPGGRTIAMKSLAQETPFEVGVVIRYRLPDGAGRRLLITGA